MAYGITQQLLRGKPPIEADVVGPAVSVQNAKPKPVSADDVTAWLAFNGKSGDASHQWTSAMRQPVESVLEGLKMRPSRAAALLGPVMDVALVQARRDRLEKFQRSFSQWVAILVNPSLWRKAIRAMWEGEEVWTYLEKESEWFQVTEAVLLDVNTRQLIGQAEAPQRRYVDGETPLHEIVVAPYKRPDEPSEFSFQVSADNAEVLVLVGVHCQLAVRVQGVVSPELRPALQNLCEEADRLFERSSLDARSRQGMIDRLLARALIKTSPACSPWTWPIAKLVGGLAAVAVFGLLLHCAVEEQHWQQTLAAIDAEPGLNIVRESSAWGRREIVGIKDERARDPKEVIEAAGMSADDLSLLFKPYRGIQPLVSLTKNIVPESHPVVQAKAEPPALAPAATPVEPPEEEAKKKEEPPPPAKVEEPKPAVVSAPPVVQPAPAPVPAATPAATVAQVVDSNVPTLPDPYGQLKTGIEAIEFHFEPGKDVLTDESASALHDIAQRLSNIQTRAEANELGLRIAFRIIRSNVPMRGAVWQLRHSLVADELVKAGIRASGIEPALQTPKPGAKQPASILDSMSLRLTLERKPAATP